MLEWCPWPDPSDHPSGVLHPMDDAVRNWSLSHRPAWLVSDSKVLAALGGTVALALLAAGAGLVAWARGARPSRAFGPLVAGAVAALLVGAAVLTAGAVATSRLVLGVHWFSDVVVGLALGAVIATAVSWSINHWFHPTPVGDPATCSTPDHG